MRLPFKLRGPEATRDEDDKFVQPRRKRRVVAHRRAEFLRQVAHLGAAQHDIERTIQRCARAGENAVDQLLLLGRHGVVGQRLKTAAAQVQIASGSLCVHSS